jgi:hypothetical protein
MRPHQVCEPMFLEQTSGCPCSHRHVSRWNKIISGRPARKKAFEINSVCRQIRPEALFSFKKCWAGLWCRPPHPSRLPPALGSDAVRV